MKNIKIINIQLLRAHEKTNQTNLKKVKKSIIKSGYFNTPIIIDKDNFIILDGHHRTQALNDLGYKKIPVLAVDYNDKKIRVTSRRKNYIVNKEEVIKRGLTNKLYPYKTSKHFIPLRPKLNKVSLDKLK